MNHQSFLRHAAIYGLASMLLQAAGFVLLPLYTRFLTPADFGLLEILGRSAEVLLNCLLLSGIRQGVVALHEQAESDQERRQVTSAAFLLLFAVALVGGGIAAFAAGPLGRSLDASGPGLVALTAAAALLEMFWLVPLTLLQTRMQSGRYLLVTLSQFLLRVAVSVLLVGSLGLGVAGVLGAMAITNFLFALLLTGSELTHGLVLPTARQVRALLAFALPFVPGGLLFFAIHYGDRYLLLHWHGRDEVGYYALGYKLALAVGTLSLNPLQMVWGVRMYREAKSSDAPEVFGRAFTRILAAYLFLGLGLCLFADEIVGVMARAAYQPASAIIAPIVLAGLFQSAAALMDAGFYIRRRTELKLVLTLSATVVTFLLYLLLIPAWGGAGAALATIGGFGFLALSTWGLSQRIFPVRYEWGRLLGLVALVFAAWLPVTVLPTGGWAILVKGSLLVALPWFAWQVGLVSHAEKQYLLELLGELRRTLRFTQRSASVERPNGLAATTLAETP